MSTTITSELSKRNKYWIPKYRYLELKYFCLQYPDWKKEYARLLEECLATSSNSEIRSSPEFVDKTSELAMKLSNLNSKISLVGKIANEIDPEIGRYILKAVTEGLSFVRLKTYYEIPCERDMYYDRYRKFFWVLDSQILQCL